MRFRRLLWSTITMTLCACAQTPVPLWPGNAPGAVGDTDLDRPAMTIYLPEASRAVPTGLVIFPGGGYGGLSMDSEGKDIAQWLNSLGVAGFVVKYRLGPRYHHPVELGDAERALRTVRSRAAEFHIAPDRIGVIGFSAGGHLASTIATHFSSGYPNAEDPIERLSSRPDFAILCYPVISFTTPYTHRGSMQHLLGDNPDPKLVENLSNELQVTGNTPPTFLFHTSADTVVPPENSVLFYMALRKAGVPAELHIFQEGPHGVGLARKDPALSVWPMLAANWLRLRGLIAK